MFRKLSPNRSNQDIRIGSGKQTSLSPLSKSKPNSIFNPNSNSNSNSDYKPNKNIINNHKKSIKHNNSSSNSALRFSQYSFRKDEKINSWKLPIVSYINPSNNQKSHRGIEFNKMLERDFPIKNNAPAICYYQPKYDFVLKSPRKQMSFDKKIKNSYESQKRFKVHKMWCSYNVKSGYELVDFNEDEN